MKLTSVLLSFLFSTSAFAFDYPEIAKEHLIKQGFGTKKIVLEQETKKSLMFWEEFVINTDDDICHIGVVVNKEHGVVVSAMADPYLELNYPYSDVKIYSRTKLIYFCAD